MSTVTFELFKNGKSVGFEEHKEAGYFNEKMIRIHHSRHGVNTWDIREWPEKYIEHDEKRLVSETKSVTDLAALKLKQQNCKHENLVGAGGISVCYDCGWDAAKPIVKCSSCLAPNSIRNNKVEIDIGDEQGSVASVQFEYCEKCGWRGDVEWFD